MLCALNTPERSVIEAAQATSGEWLGNVLGRLKVRSAAGSQVPQLAPDGPELPAGNSWPQLSSAVDDIHEVTGRIAEKEAPKSPAFLHRAVDHL
jgi:hypothetical protein